MNNIEKKLQQFLELIKKQQYDSAIEIIEEIKNLNDEEIFKYLLMVLILLNVITSLPEKEKQIINNINYDDIKLNKNSDIFGDVTKENDKRKMILYRNYSYLIKDYKNWDNNIYQNVLKTLIIQAFRVEIKDKNFLLEKIGKRQYKEAKKLLEKKSLNFKLKKIENVTLILLDKIIFFIENKNNLVKDETYTSDYTEAIARNNFTLAYELSKEYNLNNNIDLNQNPTHLLLKDICMIIESINQYQNYCQKQKIISVPIYEGIENKYDDVLKEGLITIKTKNKNKIASILKGFVEYPDITSIVLCNDEMLVLKYTPNYDTENTISKLMPSANKLKVKGKIHDALNMYFEVLKYKDLKPIVYAKIAHCMVILNKFSQARDYFIIAMELGKQQNEIYDFCSIISRLEGKLQNEEMKPNFTTKENKFDFSGQNINFGLGDISELNDAIILSCLDVESACLNLGMSEEEIELVKLVYAKEFFAKGELKLAEKFLKSVETSENKTERIKKALDEVRKNKKIYINKKETTLSLSLKLKPKK